jgi:hypothetical protein
MLGNETTSQIVQICDAEAAGALGLEKGKYYCYFKPSLANYNPAEMQKVNDNFKDDEGRYTFYLSQLFPTVQQQLLHRLYRDVFTFDPSTCPSGLLTKPLMDREFDNCFRKRTHTV